MNRLALFKTDESMKGQSALDVINAHRASQATVRAQLFRVIAKKMAGDEPLNEMETAQLTAELDAGRLTENGLKQAAAEYKKFDAQLLGVARKAQRAKELQAKAKPVRNRIAALRQDLAAAEKLLRDADLASQVSAAVLSELERTVASHPELHPEIDTRREVERAMQALPELAVC